MKLKRVLALVLALTMLLGMAACTKVPQNTLTSAQENQAQMDGDQTLYRQDKELIAELVGGQEEASDLTDAELDALIDQLINETGKENVSGVIDLSGKQEQKPVNSDMDPDAYDENGAMNKPFDQVYPDLIEKDQVAYSGESILIKMKSGNLTAGLKAAGVGALEEIVPMVGCAWYEAQLIAGTDAQEALTAVRALREVMLAEYNY